MPRLDLRGELDLIARFRRTLVACEVKTRAGDRLAHPVQAVTPEKAVRLRLLATRWLHDYQSRHHHRGPTPARPRSNQFLLERGTQLRIDVIAIRTGPRPPYPLHSLTTWSEWPDARTLLVSTPQPPLTAPPRMLTPHAVPSPTFRRHLMSGYGRSWSIGLMGLQGTPVEVEAHATSGLPKFTLIGLPDSVLTEARDRVRAAALNSGVEWPQAVLTVSLSPAWIRKQGSGFDLAIAFAVLRATGAIRQSALHDAVFLAELGLDGRVRPIRGVLPCVLAAARAGLGSVFVAEANASEAAQVSDVKVTGLRSLRQLVALANGDPMPPAPAASPPLAEHLPGDGPLPAESGFEPDLAEVVGQYEARRALELSAAGGHHLFLCGTPRGQDDARETTPRHPAAAGRPGRARSLRHSLAQRHAPLRSAADHPPAVLLDPPLGDSRVDGRRRFGPGAPWRRQPSPSRRPIPR